VTKRLSFQYLGTNEEVSMWSGRAITALVGAFLVAANAAAAASCRVIDATANFWPLAERLAKAAPAEHKQPRSGRM
jgi:hypothetical protein